MQMFINPVAYRTLRLLVEMIATSWSHTSPPTGRPDCAACGPLTISVQSWLLSSIHWPEASFFTIIPTRGGSGRIGLMCGLKCVPSLGGGLGWFTPRLNGCAESKYGLAIPFTAFGGNPIEP